MAPSLNAIAAARRDIPVMASAKMGGTGETGPNQLPSSFLGNSGETGPPEAPGSFLGHSGETGPPVTPGSKMGQNDNSAGFAHAVAQQDGSSTTSSASSSTSTASTSTKSHSTSATAAAVTSDPDIQATNSPLSQTNDQKNSFPTQSAMIAAIVVIGVIIVGIITVFFLRRVRRKYKDPKYLPGKTLKNLWTRWEPGYQAPSNPEEAAIRRQARSRANIEANRALDRQASVRSVITLPAYMAEPHEHEQVIGREGERDGVDTIVVYPETAEEEETRREERMQAMYELRLQRRAQAAEREARRQARTNSGSGASLTNPAVSSSEQLSTNMANAEAGGTRGRSTSDLTAAILNERQRRISEVNYGEVGVVRSDGSRLRSSSNASNAAHDSQPLLNEGGGRSRSGSVLSLDTSGEPHRSSEDGRNNNNNTDLGDQRLPPSYDGLDWGDAPPYNSPTAPLSRQTTLERRSRGAEEETSANRTSMRLPVVRITGASNPSSPLEDHHPSR